MKHPFDLIASNMKIIQYLGKVQESSVHHLLQIIITAKDTCPMFPKLPLTQVQCDNMPRYHRIWNRYYQNTTI